jgi:L-Ala-D/L-Glu epimerase
MPSSRSWSSSQTTALRGRGEALGVYYLDESVASMAAQVEAIAAHIEAGIDRATLQSLLPPGGARNAIDCALWDLEAKRAGRRAWELAGIEPRPLETVFTIGTRGHAGGHGGEGRRRAAHGLLKVKLDGTMPLERMQAIRRARPDARIVVDANQGWTFEQLQALAPAFAGLGVQMIEQPLPRGADEPLEAYRAPLPLCADESCLHLGELEQAARRYQMINIKLDKTGGLTHALELARARARAGPGAHGRLHGRQLARHGARRDARLAVRPRRRRRAAAAEARPARWHSLRPWPGVRLRSIAVGMTP